MVPFLFRRNRIPIANFGQFPSPSSQTTLVGKQYLMVPTPASHEQENGAEHGEMEAFRRRLERMAEQLDAECDLVQKPRFVNAVMVQPNADGRPGESLKASHTKQLDLIWVESSPAGEKSRNGTELDAIGEAMRILREATAMLDEILARWAETDTKHGNCRSHPNGTNMAQNGEHGGRMREVQRENAAAAPSIDLQSTKSPEMSSCYPSGTDRPQHLPISSKFSFPSELRRKYRMSTE